MAGFLLANHGCISGYVSYAMRDGRPLLKVYGGGYCEVGWFFSDMQVCQMKSKWSKTHPKQYHLLSGEVILPWNNHHVDDMLLEK